MDKYDLEEGTAKFGENIIVFCISLEQDAVTRPLISQMIRSGTSVGANYKEANNGSSLRDFKNKIYICKKEAGETSYWLRMILKCFPNKKESIDVLTNECLELTKIFQKVISTINQKEKIQSK